MCLKLNSQLIVIDLGRCYGEPSQSEFTVIKAEAYNGINKYLSKLSGTCMQNLEDIIEYKERNRGSEWAFSGDHPAFPKGRV